MVSTEKINMQQLKAYLKLLYKINNRKAQSSFSKKKDGSNRIVMQIVSCTIIGLPLMFIIRSMNNFDFALFSAFTFIMTLLVLNFINECSDVLFNTNESNILFHRPINDRTVFAGRLIYILLYGLVFGLAMALIPLVYLFVSDGFEVFLGFLLGTISTVFFSVSFSAFLYMVLVKAMGGEKFKKVLFVFQAVISMGLIITINLDKTFLQNVDFSTINFLSEYWVLLLPPAWEFGIVDLVSGINISITSILLAILGIIAPIGLSCISLRYLSDSFKSDMIALDNKSNRIVKKKRFALENIFARLFTHSRQEAGIFKTVFKILLRDRDFMMKMYSSSAVFVTIMGLNFYKMLGTETVMSEKKISVIIVLILYTAAMVFIMSAERFAVGEHKDISDRYKGAPVENPGMLSVAIIKSLYSIFFIPLFTLITIGMVYIWGAGTLLDVMIVFFASNIIVRVLSFSGKKKFPLSLDKAHGESFWTTMLTLFSSIFLGAVHWGVKLVPYGSLVYCLVLGILYFILIKNLRQSTWREFM